jgi:hypothetical protein
MEHSAAQHKADGMEAVLERRHDAEVSAAASQTPEEILVLVVGGHDDAAVGENHVGRHQVVARHPVPASQPSEPAAEGEPGDSGVGQGPAGGGETEGLGLAIEVDPLGAALGARRRPSLVDTHAVHQ